MADMAGRTGNSVDICVSERIMTVVSGDVSPRLLTSSFVVKVIDDESKMSNNAMLFDIEAELWAQPLPLRLFLRTEIDLENGGVSVSDLGQIR